MMGPHYFRIKERGFILVGMMGMMLLVAVVATGMNRNAGMHARITTNRAQSVQSYFGQMAGIEEALWQLTQDPNWQPARYEDLTFKKDNSVPSSITTAGGDFEADGFAAGQTIAVYANEGGIDGIYPVLSVAGNKINVPSGALKDRHGTALIQTLSGPVNSYNVVFTQGAGCENDTITKDVGNFVGDGLKKGGQFYLFSEHNIGFYTVLNDLSKTPNRIEVAHGTFTYSGMAWVSVAPLKSRTFTFNGMTYDRKLWYTMLCDQGLFAGLSCAREGSSRGLSDLVQLKMGQEVFIADTRNHRIRKADMAAKLMSTLAGNSLPSALSSPSSLWFDAGGNLYIADTENYVVKKWESGTGQLTNVAGNGSAGYAGDGGIATQAMVQRVYGITADPSGNIYIADTQNNRIRRVDAGTGIITTFAGTGSGGYSGDGLAAASAKVNLPQGVSTDADGNLFIADTGNNRIRKVDIQTGIITTLAGTGTGGYFGDAEPAVKARMDHPRAVSGNGSGNFYIADRDNNRIRKVWYDAYHQMWMIRPVAGNGAQGYAGDGVPADQTSLNKPHGIWVDASNNLYFADKDNHRVRRVDGATGIITTVAGSGAQGYNGDGISATAAKLNKPTGVCLDTAGNLFIADQDNHRVRMVDTGGTITTVAGSGAQGYNGDGISATAAKLNKPEDVHVDAAGNLYIADRDNSRIRKVDTEGIITTVAGSGAQGYNGDGISATVAQLNKPTGVQVDGFGNLYIADKDNKRVRRVDAGGTIQTVAGTGGSGYNGDGITAVTATLDRPNGIYVDAAGDLYIAETDTNMRVRRVDSGTGIITTLAGSGVEGYWGDVLPPTQAQIRAPKDVYVDGTGNLYIADTDNNRVRKVHAATGFITLVAGNGAAGYSEDGVDATTTKINKPEGVWADAGGNVYVADTGNNRIRRVDAGTGIITTAAGNGSAGYAGDGGPAADAAMKAPRDVFLDDQENMYIADTDNHMVRMVVKDSGKIYTIIGSTSGGYMGDDVPAVNTPLFEPEGLSRDPAGNTFIADTANHRIRRVDAVTGIITTVVGTGAGEYSGDGGFAIMAGIREPEDVYVDTSGNLFIADTQNHRIRKVDGETGIITTVAGNGSRGYSGDGYLATEAQINKPGSVFVDDGGNIFIADTENSCIRKVAADTGIITTVAGIGGAAGFGGDGGMATSAMVRKPTGVWVDRYGNLFIADTDNNRIRKVASDTGIITTVAGNGSAGYAGDGRSATLTLLNKPGGVAVDYYGSILIADTENHRTRKVDWETGIITTIAGTGVAGFGGDGGEPASALINTPGDVWVDRFTAGGAFERP